MKKFLSLLLALTLVLSLVVVPARATDGEESSEPKITGLSITSNASENGISRGDQVEFTLDITKATLSGVDSATIDTDSYEYAWNVGSNFEVSSGRTNHKVYTTAEKAVAKTAVSCTVTCRYTVGSGDNAKLGTVTTLVKLDEIAIADKLLPSDISYVTFNGRSYKVNDGSVAIVTMPNEDLAKGPWTAEAINNYTIDNKTEGNKPSYSKRCLTVKTTGEKPLSTTITVKDEEARVTATATPATVLSKGKVVLKAESNLSDQATYAWYLKDNEEPIGTGATFTWTVPEVTKEATYQVVCKATEKDQKTVSATAAPVTVTVQPADQFQLLVTAEQDGLLVDNPNIVLTNSTKKVEFGSTLYTTSGDKPAPVTNGVTYGYDVSGTTTAFDITGKNTDTLTVSLKSGRSGSITVTPTATYMGKTFSAKSYTISSNNLSATLPTSVENGSSITLYTKSSDRHEDANLALVAQKVLRDKVSDGLRVTEATIKEARNTTTSVTGGTISKLNSSKGTYTFTADKSSLTPAEMTIVATAGGSQYEIKLTIPVTPIMGTNFESVTADPVSSTATTTSYRVYFPTTYTNYYVVNTSGSTPGSWSSSMVSGKGYNYNTPYTLSASNFNNANGTCTLYVIAKDGVNGNYYGGQMTVSLTNYDIKYSVVAGKDVTFSQKDFDSFVKEYAKNRGDWTTASRKDYPYVEFDHAELSTIPTAKTEGTLYYKGSEVTASSNRKAEYADLDRMTFEAASKPTRDTVTLRFSLVCKKYSSASDKGSTVTYPVNVVISIVKEDITYTVGIDDSAFVKVSDFVNFLQDAKTSYRKSTLDYVKFDVSGKNVSSYAYGGLYRSYSSYSTGKLADSTDKFYYEPSRTQYDLADVAYHTTRWAEAGKTVYIPFTVYGTKNEEASGTMAITIAQTMNFIDVKASDFFYEPVKWAVNNKITNGTSSTTFSPYKNCNRAEIVTFLWRAAGSPEPTVTRNPFKDVNAVTHSSYYKAILWASQKGITAGTTATTFSPYQECTRSQIVTFLYRYAGKPSGYYSNPFKDVSSVNEASYYNAILWAVGKGITQGTSTTTFSPYASCTRGEAVTFLYRYVNGVK